jgi:hypothetical protein
VVRRGVEFNENEMSLWDGTLGVEMSKWVGLETWTHGKIGTVVETRLRTELCGRLSVAVLPQVQECFQVAGRIIPLEPPVNSTTMLDSDTGNFELLFKFWRQTGIGIACCLT